MSVTYYVALPFLRADDAVVPGQGQEMPNERLQSGWRKQCRESTSTSAHSHSNAPAIPT